MALYFYNIPDENKKLWLEYVAIDYGRAVPEKGYQGFKTFVADVTGAKVNRTTKSRLTLKFNTAEELTWFLLKYT